MKKIISAIKIAFLIVFAVVFAFSLLNNYQNFNSPVCSYRSEYDIQEIDIYDSWVPNARIAHNYALVLFDQVYRIGEKRLRNVDYTDYDLIYLGRDDQNLVWKAVFKNERAYRADDDIVLEFRDNGQVLSATGLFRPGDYCNILSSEAAAEAYAEMFFYHHCRKRSDDFVRYYFSSVKSDGKQTWEAWFLDPEWTSLGGGRCLRFRTSGEIIWVGTGE